MDSKHLDRLTRIFLKFQYSLRNDSKIRGQLRILVLGLVACIVVYYTGLSLFIAPKKEKLEGLLAKRVEINAMANKQQMAALEPKIVQLEQKKEIIQENVAILKVREKFEREQWKSLGDPNRFNNIIFTRSPAAPINIDGHLRQMTLGDKRSWEIHDQQPITLAGTGKYHDVLAYLFYLEKSPEIGSIDNLSLTSVTESELKTKNSVKFSILVNRIILKDQ